jgi:hypothetical protein
MRRTGQLKQMLPRGLEPRTFRLLAERSNQLSYESMFFLRNSDFDMLGALYDVFGHKTLGMGKK